MQIVFINRAVRVGCAGIQVFNAGLLFGERGINWSTLSLSFRVLANTERRCTIQDPTPDLRDPRFSCPCTTWCGCAISWKPRHEPTRFRRLPRGPQRASTVGRHPLHGCASTARAIGFGAYRSHSTRVFPQPARRRHAPCGVKIRRFLATVPVRPCSRRGLDGYIRTLEQVTTKIRQVSQTIATQAATFSASPTAVICVPTLGWCLRSMRLAAKHGWGG